jgi:hypothetical protein
MQILKGSPILVVDIVFLLDSFQEELLVVLLCCRQDLFVCIAPTPHPKKARGYHQDLLHMPE